MKIAMPELQQLCAIVRDAAREVLTVYDTEFQGWLKDDCTPLTQADLRADDVIRRGLEAAFPGVPVVSEESASEPDDLSDTFFLVDPLDGTKEFLKRNGEFTVNVALVHCGAPIAGVVQAPALNVSYFAAIGTGAWREGDGMTALKVGRIAPDGVLRVIGSRSHGGNALAEWLGHLEQEHVFVASGSSLKFCRIAEGRADVYPRFGPTSQWDTAAAQCVLEVAGGAVIDLSTGESLAYGLDRPILNPHFAALADRRLLELLLTRQSNSQF